jgi:hypothetical protein
MRNQKKSGHLLLLPAAILCICFTVLMQIAGRTASAEHRANVAVDPPTFQFSAATFSVNESVGSQAVTVTRTGDTSVTASVDYATSDGSAEQRTDYTLVTVKQSDNFLFS